MQSGQIFKTCKTVRCVSPKLTQSVAAAVCVCVCVSAKEVRSRMLLLRNTSAWASDPDGAERWWVSALRSNRGAGVPQRETEVRTHTAPLKHRTALITHQSARTRNNSERQGGFCRMINVWTQCLTIIAFFFKFKVSLILSKITFKVNFPYILILCVYN